MRIQLLAAVAALVLFTCGCEKPGDKPKGNDNNVAAQVEHGHAHDDEHSHEAGETHDHGDEHEHPAHGPNGGHLFEFDNNQYVGEWQQFPGNDVIKIYILDENKEPAPMKVDQFHVIPLAGNDQTPFALEAEAPDADGKSAVYMLEDQNLHIAIPLGVTIEILAGDQSITGKIAAHEPLDH